MKCPKCNEGINFKDIGKNEFVCSKCRSKLIAENYTWVLNIAFLLWGLILLPICMGGLGSATGLIVGGIIGYSVYYKLVPIFLKVVEVQ